MALVYTLILAFDRGAKRSLASLRPAYAAATGRTLVPSAFYDRVTPSLTKLMRRLDEFRRAKDESPTGLRCLRWVIGNALAVVADDAVLADMMDLARDRRYGKAREMLVVGLGNMSDERVMPVLLDLLKDDEVSHRFRRARPHDGLYEWLLVKGEHDALLLLARLVLVALVLVGGRLRLGLGDDLRAELARGAAAVQSSNGEGK